MDVLIRVDHVTFFPFTFNGSLGRERTIIILIVLVLPTNSNYELGRGDKVGGWKPQPIPSLKDVRIIQIASGGYHSSCFDR